MKIGSVVVGLLFALVAVTMVSAVASALVKSETVNISASDTMKFDLQLKGGERVYWEWATTASGEEAIDIDFYIVGPSGDVIISVQGKSADDGNALVGSSDTYTMKWDNAGGALSLSYTITYEPYDSSDMGGCCCCCCGGGMVILALACIIPLVVMKKK